MGIDSIGGVTAPVVGAGLPVGVVPADGVVVRVPLDGKPPAGVSPVGRVPGGGTAGAGLPVTVPGVSPASPALVALVAVVGVDAVGAGLPMPVRVLGGFAPGSAGAAESVLGRFAILSSADVFGSSGFGGAVVPVPKIGL
jgi:hypothetical protein